MITDYGWLWVPDIYEPDYNDYLDETESMVEMLMDVETYDDYFSDFPQTVTCDAPPFGVLR